MYSSSSLILIAALSLASGILPQASSPLLPTGSAVAKQTAFEQDFASFDANADGLLSRSETQSAKWLNHNFDEIDGNKDGELSKGEIYAYGMRMRKEQLTGFDERFRSADKDGDHALSRQEAESGQMMQVAMHFESIDANEDGKVTMEELRAYLKRFVRSSPMV